MKFSEQWLREWVNPNVATAELAEQLTMAGLEVDSIEPAAAEFTNIVVGEVLTVEKHPEADRLNVCTVNVGEAEPLNIVCGAKNVAVGVRVPTAMVGAVLPGNFKIKKAKLRGVPSHGMLCSEAEIGLAESAEGLMLLAADAPVGTNIREYLSLDDQIIEVDFTPNRGDCLSIKGLAREVSVLNNVEITEPEIKAVMPQIDDSFPVSVAAGEDCPIYLGRVIRNINPDAETPLWMQERLRRAGNRSLGPLVDITNYILLELGQPMHAFDLDMLKGGIQVRRASSGEKIKLLDESEITLNENMLVIADEQGAKAFAGVMGGNDSAVGDNTTNIFLECAFFNPDVIRGKARHYGMQTDSSYRFERGVDFAQTAKAMERATELVLQIAGGEAGPITDVSDSTVLPQRQVIDLRLTQIRRVLGIEIDINEVTTIMQGLGMMVESGVDSWKITPPSWRFDIQIEADLIEEVGRIYGYNRIPATLPTSNLKFVSQPEGQVGKRSIRRLLVDRGYQETIAYSFVDPQVQALIDPEAKPLTLANPISSEMSVMRTTLWPNLIKAVEYNQSRQQNRVRLFEIGRRFVPEGDTFRQDTVISGIASGGAMPDHWDLKAQQADFFHIKSDVEAILGLTRSAKDFIFRAEQHPALHPGQSAEILLDGQQVGWLGSLHPSIQKQLDLTHSPILFELDMQVLTSGRVPVFSSISKFPSIRRDLALVMDDSVVAGQVDSVIRRVGGDRLIGLQLFDVYRGKGIAKGKKSLALALTIQDQTQTLTDETVDTLIRDILVSIESETGATLRE